MINQSWIPLIANTPFVVFAVCSFIHLFNALIARLSQTFSNVHQDRKSYLSYKAYWELFEDVVLVRGLATRLSFLEKTVHWIRNNEVGWSSTYLKQHQGNSNLNITRPETNVVQIKGRFRYYMYIFWTT